MSEPTNTPPSHSLPDPPQPPPKFRQRASELFKHGKEEFLDLFSLHWDTDEHGTVEAIHRSMEFKGGNLWGLIFAAAIAAIGLNMNSGAVVIGAMLISPLMGPIVGIGYALATNDFNTLKKGFRNLAIFVMGSVFASTFYFMISPIKTLTDQLEARTYPTFYDVMIAIFGGAIGIVASSRADRGNAIPGVAIATALMPPLCTVGYGIATGQWSYAGGAFYLFCINCVFIAGTSFIFVRALRFPQKEFLDPAREQRYKMIMISIVVLTIIPSLWTGYNLVQRELFNSKALLFEQRVEEYNPSKGIIIGQRVEYRRDTPTIVLTVSGGLYVNDKNNLQTVLADVGLDHARLEYREANLDVETLVAEVQGLQSKVTVLGEEYKELLENAYRDNNIALKNKAERIAFLESELAKYQVQRKRKARPVNDIASEFAALYPEAVEISYNELVKMNTVSKTLDTLPTVLINWEGRRMSSKQRTRVTNFFQTRMKLDTVAVVIY